MSERRESDEGLTTAAAPRVTALVRHPQFVCDPWLERQHSILERLHRSLPPEARPYSSPELNAVWLQLGSEWSWVVLVPSEPDYSTAGLARALSETGTRLCIYPVELADARGLDLDGSSRLIAQLGISAREGCVWSSNGLASSTYAPPITKTIVALDSPLANPLALPIALAADGVVLCVRRGRDRTASVRDTIQSVGTDRILCCVLVD
jgi:hypothetical protein